MQRLGIIMALLLRVANDLVNQKVLTTGMKKGKYLQPNLQTCIKKQKWDVGAHTIMSSPIPYFIRKIVVHCILIYFPLLLLRR